MTKSSYNTKIRRFLLKREAVKLKGGICIRCGWSGNIAAFHFHHRDPSQKEFGLSSAITTNWEKYWAEVEKCDLLCANCHMIHHADNNTEEFLNRVNNYDGRKLIVSNIPWKNKIHIANPKYYTHTCPTCNSIFNTKTFQQKFCSHKCRANGQRKCVHPLKNELELMIKNLPMTQIGKKFGVSDNAVRKWCKNYNIKI